MEKGQVDLMDAITYLRDAFKELHRQLEATMEDVTPAQAHWLPPGGLSWQATATATWARSRA